ncbi:MAG: LacI family transcriptional regulator [Rariglobus sp.]|jgi:DNA-binding LacI/PurR family transcriptional regulator|nr:LacI family transcriptional regulator [Rariglobus sp.]
MKEVAAEAKVSPSTVCRALGTDPQIPEATRKRIRKVATALGYRPDPLISALSRRRRGAASGVEITTLAYVTNFETADEWMRHPFYGPVFDGAKAQALRNGYRMEHFWMREPGMTGERLSRILYNRGIGGVCIAPTPTDRGRLDLDWTRFSCVTIGYSLLHPVLHRTTPHHFHAILVASRKLWRRGYTRIGLCLYVSTSPRVDDLWLSGALLTQHHNPQAPLKVFLFNDDTRANIPTWALSENLEVVVSDNVQALHELQRAGIRAPGDVDYATLNWTKAEPEIAGINQRPNSIGSAAVDLLIAQLRRGERGVPEIPVTSMIEGVWVNGPSLLRESVSSK